MKHILITGITGKSGTYMLKKMIEDAEHLKEYNFGFIVRKTSKTEDIKNAPINKTIYIGDIDNSNDIDKILMDGGYDTLLHIAGISHSVKLVTLAVHHGIKRLILVHTTGIYSKYKAAGENYRTIEKSIIDIIANKDISLTILRPTMIYGNIYDQNIVKFIGMVDKMRLFPIVKHGTFGLQPVHQKDLGNAYYQVMINSEKTENKDYILSGERPIDLIDILKLISFYMDKRTHFFSVPFWVAYSGACVIYAVSFTKIDFREKVQRLVEPRTFSHEDATRDFNYAPMSFNEGLKEEVKDYLEFKLSNTK